MRCFQHARPSASDVSMPSFDDLKRRTSRPMARAGKDLVENPGFRPGESRAAAGTTSFTQADAIRFGSTDHLSGKNELEPHDPCHHQSGQNAECLHRQEM